MGAEEFVVALPPGRCEEPVRTYATFTSGVLALRDWLLGCGIKTAAMKSLTEMNLKLQHVFSAGLFCALISEIGTREQLLAAFPTPERFPPWMGLCPDNRISGGKVLKAKTRKVQSRWAGAFRLGVFGLQRSQTQMGVTCAG